MSDAIPVLNDSLVRIEQNREGWNPIPPVEPIFWDVLRDPMDKPLNLMIIGCGAIVDEYHLNIILRLVQAGALRVVAVVDRDEARTKRLTQIFPTARGANEVEPLLERAVDVALVASPPSLHRKHVEAVLEHGGHVLCEKPLSTNVCDAISIAKTAQRFNRLVAVGLPRRFYPSLATGAAILQSGELGRNLRFTCREGSVYGWPVASDAPFRRQLGGGGVLIDKGVHVLDSLFWLFGSMSIAESRDDALGGGVETNCQLLLSNSNAVGTVQLSWDQTLVNGLFVEGSDGELFINPEEFRWVEIRHGDKPWERRPCNASWPATLDKANPGPMTPSDYSDCIFLEWIQFLRAVTFSEPLSVGTAAAVPVQQQIDSAYAIAAPLEQQWLTSTEQTETISRHWHSPSATSS